MAPTAETLTHINPKLATTRVPGRMNLALLGRNASGNVVVSLSRALSLALLPHFAYNALNNKDPLHIKHYARK